MTRQEQTLEQWIDKGASASFRFDVNGQPLDRLDAWPPTELTIEKVQSEAESTERWLVVHVRNDGPGQLAQVTAVFPFTVPCEARTLGFSVDVDERGYGTADVNVQAHQAELQLRAISVPSFQARHVEVLNVWIDGREVLRPVRPALTKKLLDLSSHYRPFLPSARLTGSEQLKVRVKSSVSSSRVSLSLSTVATPLV